MTQEQKNTITSMRGEGYGYAAIASVLNISKNTVKTFCNRNGLAGKRQEENKLVLPENVCKYCGASLIHTEGHRKKQFCSKKCSNAWWNAQTAKNAAKDKVHTCPGCGKEFYSSGKKIRKYCTFDCYINDRFHKGGDVV